MANGYPVARYRPARITSATSAAAAHRATRRARPAGARTKHAENNVIARAETGRDGNVYVVVVTAAATGGFGRGTNSARLTTQSVATRVPRNTTRCRMRRNASRTTTTTPRMIITAVKAVSAFNTLATSVRAAVR